MRLIIFSLAFTLAHIFLNVETRIFTGKREEASNKLKCPTEIHVLSTDVDNGHNVRPTADRKETATCGTQNEETFTRATAIPLETRRQGYFPLNVHRNDDVCSRGHPLSIYRFFSSSFAV